MILRTSRRLVASCEPLSPSPTDILYLGILPSTNRSVFKPNIEHKIFYHSEREVFKAPVCLEVATSLFGNKIHKGKFLILI